MEIYKSGSIIANRYEVAGRPLLGGMGIVYLCIDRQEDRPVALKTFQPQFLPDRASRDRFLREGTTWVDLGRHPHIVRCYNIDRIGDGREVFLSLELVAQEQDRQDASLRSWLTPGQALPVEQSLLFALQIVRGMRHACEKIPGFVHRDLKPENILVGADKLPSLGTNRLRVTDFGLSNILSVSGVSAQASGEIDASENLSRTQLTHGILGTPLYMAPEQWLKGQLGSWTDIYALGCILSEMLTGQFAVNGSNQQSLMKAHCKGQVHALPSSLPAVVQDLVADCLRLAPGERYQDWGSLESALGTAWEAISAQALPPTEASQGLDREERVAVGWSYSNIGNSYLDIGKADVARDYFERAVAVGQAEEERHLEGAALGNLGIAYRNLGDARRAIGYHEQALEISREIGDRRAEGADLDNLGLVYSDLRDARRAIGYHEQALEISREIGDRRGEGNSLGNLGIAYAQLGDARRAIGYYEQRLEIAREIRDRRGEGNVLGNLGIAYKDFGDARRAIGYLEQQLVITREIGDRRGEGNSLGNLGLAYENLGDARRAIGYHEQALKISREIGDRLGAAMTGANMGMAFAQIGEVDRAITFVEQAVLDFKEAGYPLQAQKAERMLAQIQGRDAPGSNATQADLVKAAFGAFQRAGSTQEMQSAAAQYPFMTEDGFIDAIEKVIKEQVPPERKAAFKQRLTWLRQIAEN